MLINRFAAKCKLCKARWTTVKDRQQAFTDHELVCPRYTEVFTPRVERTRKYINISDPVDAERYQMSVIYFEYLQISGHFNNSVKCDARCESATRHICECSCGGENHGSAKVA